MARAVLGFVGACVLAGCSTRDASVLGGDPVRVTSDAGSCVLSASKSLAGKVVFDVSNTGNEPITFAVLANNEVTVIATSAAIEPGGKATVKTTLMPGGFVTSCKPAGAGKEFRNPFEVTGENLE